MLTYNTKYLYHSSFRYYGLLADMGNISAVVATLNEEERIRGCLKTVSWCDEIVVVDNDSSDDTTEIAAEYTDEIFQYKKRHGYGDPLKIYGIEKASNEWIVLIDADELVPISLAKRLRKIVDESEADVVRIPFKNHTLGIWAKGAGWWPDFHARCFRRDAVNVTDEIHGYLNVDDNADLLELPARERNCIVHFNHVDIEDKVDRVNTYTTVEAEGADFTFRKLVAAPVIEFFNRLVLKNGYRLGCHGVLLAIMQAWYEWLVAVKRWEMDRMGGREGIEDRYNLIRREVLSEWENE